MSLGTADPPVDDGSDRRVRRDVVDGDLEEVVARLEALVPWENTVYRRRRGT